MDNGFELASQPEDIEVDSFRFEIAENRERLTSTALYMCVCIALYDQNSKIGAMAHDMIRDESLEEKFQKFLTKTGGKISHIVITGGAHAKDYDEKLDRAIEENLEHVRQVAQKFQGIAIIHEHQSSNDTRTVLTMDTENGIFEIFVGPDERKVKNPDFVKRKLTIKDGKEKWQFQR
jgi:chemotaxis receptor (MCP) glutamine deamidase CheD